MKAKTTLTLKNRSAEQESSLLCPMIATEKMVFHCFCLQRDGRHDSGLASGVAVDKKLAYLDRATPLVITALKELSISLKVLFLFLSLSTKLKKNHKNR